MSSLAEYGIKHQCGVLMHISSLPSDYGIGCFGKPCFDFIDFLAATGQHVWQVLPLNPTTYGDSPYQSPASFALNPYFINPNDLYLQKLLTKEELLLAKTKASKVNYGELFEKRYPLLRLAFSRFKSSNQYKKFLIANAYWLEDYATFMALKVKNGFSSWTDWDGQDRNKDTAVTSEKEKDFWRFVQYECATQWTAVLAYAHKKKIQILGDMPIYVAMDSVDVWSNPNEFLLSSDYVPTVVAGVPPDYFSEDGQLWGNPLYDWDKMEQEDFAWWKTRVKRSFELYDLLRIDHFRGFSAYFAIPYGDVNARRGEWREGKGKALFAAINKAYPNAKIIAEDLGVITQDVRELLAYTGFPGMKVLQFAFEKDDSEYMPRMYDTDNCVVYTGTHDSDLAASWCAALSKDALKRFESETHREKGETRMDAAIRIALCSRSDLVVIPLQDYLGLKNANGRMNTPSMSAGNWTWRASKRSFSENLRKKMRKMAKVGNR